MGSFGDMLKGFRRRAGLSQGKLAQAVGIDRSYVCRIESGEREAPSRSLALALADILGLSRAECDLWLVSAGYVSPWMQELAASGVARLREEISVLSGSNDADNTHE